MILYISKRADVGSTTHLEALKEIYGDKNVFYVDFSFNKPYKREENYICYGKYNGQIERVKRIIQKNTMIISNKIIRELCEIIVNKDIDIIFSEESVIGSFYKQAKKIKKDIKIITF